MADQLDIDILKRDVAKLRSVNAPDEDIDQHIKENGWDPDAFIQAVKNPNPKINESLLQGNIAPVKTLTPDQQMIQYQKAQSDKKYNDWKNGVITDSLEPKTLAGKIMSTMNPMNIQNDILQGKLKGNYEDVWMKDVLPNVIMAMPELKAGVAGLTDKELLKQVLNDTPLKNAFGRAFKYIKENVKLPSAVETPLSVATKVKEPSLAEIAKYPNKHVEPVIGDAIEDYFEKRISAYSDYVDQAELNHPTKIKISDILDDLYDADAFLKSHPKLADALANPEGITIKEAVKLKNDLKWKGWSDETQVRHALVDKLMDFPEMEKAHGMYRQVMTDWKYLKKYVNPRSPNAIASALSKEEPLGGQSAEDVLVRALQDNPKALKRAQDFIKVSRLKRTFGNFGIPKTDIKIKNIPGIRQPSSILQAKPKTDVQGDALLKALKNLEGK